MGERLVQAQRAGRRAGFRPLARSHMQSVGKVLELVSLQTFRGLQSGVAVVVLVTATTACALLAVRLCMEEVAVVLGAA